MISTGTAALCSGNATNFTRTLTPKHVGEVLGNDSNSQNQSGLTATQYRYSEDARHSQCFALTRRSIIRLIAACSNPTMAFNFQPQADCSDEEGGLDLATWQSGARDTNGTASKVDDSLEQALQDSARRQPSASVANSSTAALSSSSRLALGFTSINRSEPAEPLPLAFHSLEDPVDTTHSHDANLMTEPGSEDDLDLHIAVARDLVPVIPRANSPGSDVFDYTAGDDVVRQVLSKKLESTGLVLYEVEFEDYSVQWVSGCLSSLRVAQFKVVRSKLL